MCISTEGGFSFFNLERRLKYVIQMRVFVRQIADFAYNLLETSGKQRFGKL